VGRGVGSSALAPLLHCYFRRIATCATQEHDIGILRHHKHAKVLVIVGWSNIVWLQGLVELICRRMPSISAHFR